MNQESYLCERIRFIIAQAQQKIQSSLDIATVKTRQEIIITMDRNQEGKSNYLTLKKGKKFEIPYFRK